MTEEQLRDKVVSTFMEWLGRKESDNSHRPIIDIYNSHEPLARGIKMYYTYAWCAAAVSAVAIVCEITDIMPTEIYVPCMLQLYKDIGRWHERTERSGGFIPQKGDVIIFQNSRDGKGASHVGIVASISGNIVTTIEGNKDHAVGQRTIAINDTYIRGYGTPDYASKASEEPEEPEEPDDPEQPQKKGVFKIDYSKIMTNFITKLDDSTFAAYNPPSPYYSFNQHDGIRKGVDWGYYTGCIVGDGNAQTVEQMNEHYFKDINKYDLSRVLYTLTHTAAEYNSTMFITGKSWNDSLKETNQGIMFPAADATWGAVPTRSQLIQIFYRYNKVNLDVLNSAWGIDIDNCKLFADGIIKAVPSMGAFNALAASVGALYGEGSEGYRSIFNGKEVDSAVALFTSYVKDGTGNSNLVLFQDGHWGEIVSSNYLPISGGELTGSLSLGGNFLKLHQDVGIRADENNIYFEGQMGSPINLRNIKTPDADSPSSIAANKEYVDSKDFIINAENQQGNVQSDKTFAQIKNAFLNNKNITLKVDDSSEDIYIIRDFYYYNDNSDREQFGFRVNYLSTKKTFILGVDNEWVVITDT